MKKKKLVYFIAPVVGMVIFAAIYWQYVSTYDARQAALAAKIRKEKEETVAKENADKKLAYDQAMKAKAAREKEKAEKAAHDQKEKDDQAAAEQALNKAQSDALQQARNVERIKADVKTAEKELDEIKKEEAESEKEEAFLKGYVVTIQQDAHKLDGVVEKIDAADDAAAKAAAAAARAKKEKENS